jgi:DNA-binding NtrC family response regulator
MITVLFIDDDPLITAVAKEIFIHNNINCIICDSYECATLAIENAKIDLVVLDIVLKGEKTGVDILNYMRLKKIKVPVIVTTGYGDKYNEILSSYKIHYLEKPYLPEQLVNKINKII